MEFIQSLITPSKLSLFSHSPIIGAWWEELEARCLFDGQKPEVGALDQQLFDDGIRHERALAAKLHEHVLVAHNLRGFDGPILEAHFAEVDGIDLSLGSGIDTMPTPRVKLVDLCARHGVQLDPDVAHTALGDTRALTKALQSGMAHLAPAGSAVSVGRNGLLTQPAQALTRKMVAATGSPSGWTAVALPLEAGQLFITTGPASTKPDTEIKRAEAHGVRLGLEYRKVNSIPKRNPPAFLLSTSLTLANRKMADARELQLPVVLCRDFMQARCGTSVRAWRYQA